MASQFEHVQNFEHRGKGFPDYLKYFRPLIQVLKELGGSGTIPEVVDRMVEKLNIPESEQARPLKNGTPYITNRIAWVRYYLAKGGLIYASQRGIWSLTKKAFVTDLTDKMALQLFKDCKKFLANIRHKHSRLLKLFGRA